MSFKGSAAIFTTTLLSVSFATLRDQIKDWPPSYKAGLPITENWIPETRIPDRLATILRDLVLLFGLHWKLQTVELLGGIEA